MEKKQNSRLICFPSELAWYKRQTTWWFFTRKYVHHITFNHQTQYSGSMTYDSKGSGSHCHEDGVWCVTHGDPDSQEMILWYKGINYEYQVKSRICYKDRGEYDDCDMYKDYIAI
jgi:hypothetical protein